MKAALIICSKVWSLKKNREASTANDSLPPIGSLQKKCLHSYDGALKNIRSNYYDLVICESVFRSDEFLDDVVKHYPGEKIIFIDGENEDFYFRLARGCCYRFFLEPKDLPYGSNSRQSCRKQFAEYGNLGKQSHI